MSSSVLTTTRYVKPGVYIGRIIRPAPVSQNFVRTPCYVAKGSKRQTRYNIPIRRSYKQSVQMQFSKVAPNMAPLVDPAKPDQTVAKLYTSNGAPVAASKWRFLESVPGSGVFDQVLIIPESFDPNATYFLDYQSTSRTVLDPLGFTDLRVVKNVGDTENQNKYVENRDYLITTLVTDPLPNIALPTPNAYPTVASNGFTPVVPGIGNTGTGTVTTPVTGYTHKYSRTYTLKVLSVALGTITFQWEAMQNSGGNDSLPNVPLSISGVSAPTFTQAQTTTATHNLTFTYPVDTAHPLGLTSDLGVSVTIADTGIPIAADDTWRFTAMGPGVIELDTSYANTNQFSEISTPTGSNASLPTAGSETSSAVWPITTFVNGETFIGTVDGVGTATLTLNTTRASVTGAAATYAPVLAAQHLDLTINGVPGTQVLSFAGTEVSQATWLAAINGLILGASAVDNAGQVKIQTDAFGATAGGTILGSSSASVLASLGLSAGAFTNLGPNTVSNIHSVSSAEFAVLLSSTFAGSTGTSIGGNTVSWTSNTTGASSSVQFTGGTGVAKVAGFDTALHSGTNASTGTGNITLHDYSEYTGTSNRSYVLQVVAASGLLGSRQASFIWQGWGESYPTCSPLAFTVLEVTPSSMSGIPLELGISLDFAFGASNFVVGDQFTFEATAARRQPVAKDNRDYKLQVTASPIPGTLKMLYSGSTPEASFGIINIAAATGTLTWNLTAVAAYAKPTDGTFTIPGDFVLHARNIGAATVEKRYTTAAPDKFTFSSIDQLTMDWNLNARTTETFNGSQVFQDILGTITGTAGGYYAILNNTPVLGIVGDPNLPRIKYVHNEPSGLPLAYVPIVNTSLSGVKSATPYIYFPMGKPTGNVSVYYEYNGLEPDPGNVYYLTVDVLRPTTLYNLPVKVVTRDDMRRMFGPMAPDNDANIMGEIAFDNGVPQMMVSQVYDTDHDGVYTNYDYTQALLGTELNSELTDVVVLNGYGILGQALQSNERMNDPFERKERMLWVGAPSLTAIGDTNTDGTLVSLARITMQVFGDSQAHGRRVLLGNTWATRTIALSDGSQVSVPLDGSFVAGASAAYNASFTDPGEVLLRKTLAGFDTMQTYQESEELQLGAASILYLTDIGSNVYRFEESVTVDTISSDNNEISAQNQIIYVTRDMRNSLDSSLISVVPESQQAGVALIQGVMVSKLAGYVSSGKIAPYSNDDGSTRPIDPSNDIVVFRATDDKTLYNIKYYFNIKYQIKRIFGLYSVDKKLFGI